MLYSVQTPFGEVLGHFEVPYANPPLPVEEYAERVGTVLEDDPRVEEVKASPLVSAVGNGMYDRIDRIVVRTKPYSLIDHSKMLDIHVAVGLVWLMHEIGES